MESIDNSLIDDLDKNPKYVFHELLEILTLFYTFRELSKILDVPVQTLWKYRTLRATPEKESALKLISKIRSSRLIEEILDKLKNSQDEPLVLLNKPGVLELITFIACDHVRKLKPSLILAMPDPYSSAIATLTSVKNRIRLCLSDKQLSPRNSICTVIVDSDNRVTPLCVPTECFSKRNKVMVISSIYLNGYIKSIVSILKKSGQILDEIFIVYGSRDVVEKEISELKELNINYFIVFNKNSK
ncbi:MAG: hypothetical protein QXX35_04850 [Desulfurococcaceae archaeon]|uniref:Uncharacterized protein n=1 Tax=Staphylothermus marinus TaxID=2280 RepID=A0A7C4H955_STAMA